MKKLQYLIVVFALFLAFGINAKAASNPIKDGVYTISSAINNDYVLDANGGKMKNGTNIQLWEGMELDSQKWKVTYKNGYYSIVSAKGTSYSLDVSGAKKTKGTNIQLWKTTDGAAQEWILKDAGDGYYYIIAKSSGMYLDVSNGKAANKTNIQIWTENKSKAQKFKFSSTEKVKKTVEDGIYTISSAINHNYVLDVSGGKMKNGTNIQLWKGANIESQQWKVTYLNNGYYSITSAKNTNYSLDVSGAKKTKGTNIQLWQTTDGAAQEWLLKDAGDGYYYIITKSSGMYLDVSNGKAANKTNIQIWTENKSNAQKFVFSPVVTGKKTLDDGVYVISSALTDTSVIDLSEGKRQNAQNIQLYKFNNSDAQQWEVKYLGDGTYEIASFIDYGYGLGDVSCIDEEECPELDKYVLDVTGGRKTKGTNVQLYESNGSDAQRWIIKDAGNGYYNVISKTSGLYLDIDGAKTANKTNIQTWIGNGNKAQKFKFSKAYNLYAYVDFEQTDEDEEEKTTTYTVSVNAYSYPYDEGLEINGAELYRSKTEDGTYTKLEISSKYEIEQVLRENEQYYYKARVYKDTVNGRIYSDYSYVRGLNLLESEATVWQDYSQQGTDIYRVGLELPNVPFWGEYVEGAILEVSLYNYETDEWEIIKTEEDSFFTEIRVDKDDYSIRYRLRVSIVKDGVRLYSEYDYLNPATYVANIPSFNMYVEQEVVGDTVDVHVSTDREADYMEIYLLNEQEQYIETLYFGEELSTTLNVEGNSRIQMQLFNSHHEPIATSFPYYIDYATPTIHFSINDEDEESPYCYYLTGLSRLSENASYGELYIKNTSIGGEELHETIEDLSDLPSGSICMNKGNFIKNNTYKMVLKVYDQNSQLLDTLESDTIEAIYDYNNFRVYYSEDIEDYYYIFDNISQLPNNATRVEMYLVTDGEIGNEIIRTHDDFDNISAFGGQLQLNIENGHTYKMIAKVYVEGQNEPAFTFESNELDLR